MKDSPHILAILLASEEHPHLRDEPDFLEASAALSASTDLQKQFAESKAFLDAHPVLTKIDGLPEDSRARIEAVLKAEMNKKPEGKVVPMNPFGVRKQFAWAAALALLLAGMSLVSSSIIRQQDQGHLVSVNSELTPEQAFHYFVGSMAAKPRMPLQHRNSQGNQLVSWLGEQGAPSFSAPERLMNTETMGCAYLEGPDGKVSLICFDTDKGIVHLFVTPSESLHLEGQSSPRSMILNDRKALKWHDEQNAYILIGHEAEQELPEVFL